MSTRIICHSALALLSCMLLYACNSLPTETKEKIPKEWLMHESASGRRIFRQFSWNSERNALTL